MAFVITYGPLNAKEKTITRETAEEALAAVVTLREEGARHFTVTHVSNDDTALGALRLLAAGDPPA